MNYVFLKIYDEVRKSGLPNYLDVRCPINSGLIIPAWSSKLVDFPDTQLVDFLEFGWPLDYTSAKVPTPTLINHAKEADNDIHINKFIQKECKLGAMLGPFTLAPFEPWCQVSP